MMKRVFPLLIVIASFALLPGVMADAPPEPEDVEIEMPDGTAIVGTYYLPPTDVIFEDAYTGVLLLHMLNSRRGAWEPIIEHLTANDYAVLAVDMRGHGDTGGPQDWDAAIADVPVLLDWLREQIEVGDTVAVMGGSIGSNVALMGCADDPGCVTAIALSPGLDYRGVMPLESVESGLADRATLLVAAHADRTSAEAVREMATAAQGEVGMRLYPGRAHGTNLLTSSDGERVIGMIVNWLDEHTSSE